MNKNLSPSANEELWDKNIDGSFPVLVEIYNPDIYWGYTKSGDEDENLIVEEYEKRWVGFSSINTNIIGLRVEDSSFNNITSAMDFIENAQKYTSPKINLYKRKFVNSSLLLNKGYEIESNTYATVYGYGRGDEEKACLLTPITQDGTIPYTPSELEAYGDTYLSDGSDPLGLVLYTFNNNTTEEQNSYAEKLHEALGILDYQDTLDYVNVKNNTHNESYYEQENCYLRLISTDTKVIYNNHTWIPCSMDFSPPEVDGTKIGTASLTMSSIDARVRFILRNLKIPSTVKIVALFTKVKNQDSGKIIYKFVKLNGKEFSMEAASSNSMTATFNLVYNKSLQQSVPYDIATADRAPAASK